MPGRKTICEVPPEIRIELPPALREEARRIANEENWTLGKAIVFLVQRGADAQRQAEQELKRSYERVINDREDPTKKPEARKDLIRAIFGPEAIAKDQVR